MARFTVTGFPELQAQLAKEGTRIQQRGRKAVEAGAGVLADAIKEQVPKRTGDLAAHVQAHPVTYSSTDGFSCEVYPDGVRADGQRYAEVAYVLEYGRTNMAAQPYMQAAVDRAETAVVDAMRGVLFSDDDQ